MPGEEEGGALWWAAARQVSHVGLTTWDYCFLLTILMCLPAQKKSSEQMEVDPNAPPPFSDDAMIHAIAEDIIQRWRVFVFLIPDTVFRISSLMCSLCERMGSEYMGKLHEQLMAEVLLPESEAFMAYFEGLTDEEKYLKLRDPNFKDELGRFRIVMHLLAQYAKVSFDGS